MARPRRPPTAAGEGDGNSDELGKLREELAATRAKLDAVIAGLPAGLDTFAR